MKYSLLIDGTPVELAEALSKLADTEPVAALPTPPTTKKAKAEKTEKATIADAPPTAETPEPTAETKTERITLEQLRKLCAEKSKGDPEKKAAVKAAIKECGADSLGDLEEDKFAELLEKLQNL